MSFIVLHQRPRQPITSAPIKCMIVVIALWLRYLDFARRFFRYQQTIWVCFSYYWFHLNFLNHSWKQQTFLHWPFLDFYNRSGKETFIPRWIWMAWRLPMPALQSTRDSLRLCERGRGGTSNSWRGDTRHGRRVRAVLRRPSRKGHCSLAGPPIPLSSSIGECRRLKF